MAQTPRARVCFAFGALRESFIPGCRFDLFSGFSLLSACSFLSGPQRRTAPACTGPRRNSTPCRVGALTCASTCAFVRTRARTVQLAYVRVPVCASARVWFICRSWLVSDWHRLSSSIMRHSQSASGFSPGNVKRSLRFQVGYLKLEPVNNFGHYH